MSMFKDLNVVYVYVKDWEAAKKFYRETLEWPVAYSDDKIGWRWGSMSYISSKSLIYSSTRA